MSKLEVLMAASLAVIIFASAAGAQSTAERELDARLRGVDAWLDRQVHASQAPGLSAALVHDQNVVWSAGYGLSNVETGAPATPDTAYSVCSISKLFTSIAVMRLVEAGRMELDAPLSDYVPEIALPAPDGVIEEPISVRAALSHAAGLPREGGTPYWTEVDFPDRETLLTRLAGQERLYTPYDTWQYSNLGMSILGEAVARVSERDYHTFVRDEILNPLGLSGVTSELPNDQHGERFAVGYKMFDRTGARAAWAPYTLNAVAPAAGFAASVTDLAGFAAWQFRLLESGETEVLSRAALREMHRVQWADPADPESPMWGLGFGHSRRAGETVIGHGGYCPGYRADFSLRVPDKIAVAVMVNANDVSPSEIASGIYAMAAASVVAVRGGDDEESAEDPLPFEEYEGVYAVAGYDWDDYVVPTVEGLLIVPLYSETPIEDALTLSHVESDVFRREREEGGLGETVRFERDAEGRITRYWRHGIYLTRMDG